MIKYFDSTFFKFLLGFIGILAVSFGLLFLSQYWSKSENPDATYVAVPVESSQQ